MRIGLETLFLIDRGRRLVAVNDPSHSEAPRFFLGSTGDGCVWAVRHDVDADLTRELEMLAASEPPIPEVGPHPVASKPYVDALLTRGPIRKIWSGPAFRFPDRLPEAPDTVPVTPQNVDVLRPHLVDWIQDVAAGVPTAAALSEGHAASVCCSVRIGARAHEAGVETHVDFRRRGLGTRAVLTWARLVRAGGLIPLYSTSWDNDASRQLARRLGLTQYGSLLHIT
jgi:hypothetical protein